MKKRFLNRDRILYFVVMILSVLFLYVGNRIAVQDNSYFQSSRADTYYRAEVIAVGEPQQIENTYDGWSESYIEQDITIRLLGRGAPGRGSDSPSAAPDPQGGL